MKYSLPWLCAVISLSFVNVNLSPGVLAAAAPDIVIHASDVAQFVGMSLVEDRTAAGGLKLSTEDEGRASLDRPSESFPVARFTFDVPSGGNYHVWLRMKGKGNSKFNESLWVQLSNATQNGSPVYRWGSRDGLLVNLEDCWNCGIREWGWQDNSWWLNQSAVVTLPSGSQSIYVSVREDGVEFDQIVLSPETYLTSAPGAVKDDGTIFASTQERILIQDGSFVFDGPDGRGTLTGTNGFSLTAAASANFGGDGAFVHCGLVGCPADADVSFVGNWTGSDLFVLHVSYRGTTYDSNNSAADSGVGFRLSGTVRTPPVPQPAVDGQEATSVTTFQAGDFFNYVGQPGQPTGRAVIIGNGTVTMRFRWSTADQGWYFAGAEFSFHDASGRPPSTTEIVLWASDVVALEGLSLDADPTAAGGQKISSADNGGQWLNTPPPPGDAPYASFAFHVPATGNYRVWLRVKGQGNTKFNESVWVQFSTALRNGAPAYRWGTNDGLLVNLENCSACGIQEWGWQDNSWWLNQSSLVTLGAGMHTMYVTVREDGVEFDQIVLSRERYLTTSPGPVKNDTTIVSKPVMADQVHVTEATMAFDGEIADLLASGPDGFSITARFSPRSGAPDHAGVFVCGRSGCPPGWLATINGFWLGEDFMGSATYRGETYVFDRDVTGGEIRFRGFVRIPSSGTSAIISAPFTIGGVIRYPRDGLTRTVNYLGGGHATFHMRLEPNDGLWYIEQYDFEFSRPSNE